jgi:adenosine kinase
VEHSALSILLSGSLAFDHIMVFPGHFEDHILPDKIHILNVSFLVDSLDRLRGGVAGNLAYNLALLRQPCKIVATVGRDFDEYSAALAGMGVDVSAIEIIQDELTASAFITTDRADNQITGFYPGAMSRAAELSLTPHLATTDVAVVSPTDPKAMRRHARELSDSGTRYVFDPGQQIISLSAAALQEGIEGADTLVGNDYEFAMMAEKSGMTRDELERACPTVIVTFGELGSRIYHSGERSDVPAVRPRAVVDPTGAGDGYRAGYLAGLRAGLPIEAAGRIASLAATYVVEVKGTQSHEYTLDEFATRFTENFPDYGQAIDTFMANARASS